MFSHHPQRTWFPFILIGLTLALCAFLFILYRTPQDVEIVQQVALTQDEYRSQVSDVLNTFMPSKDAQIAYDALLVMRVPEEEKQTHLDLVLLFGKIIAGEIDDIDLAISDIGVKYPWMPVYLAK
jgi:hypothetical protein